MTSFPTALHHRIRELARRAPDAPALAAPFQNDLRLSRGVLDARASHLARQLRAAGVGAEVRVGVCVERSCELFVALLAVLKAGGVFVPLDPRHPAARLDWIVRDAQLRHGIVDAAGRAALGAPFEYAFDAMSAAAAAAAFVDDEDVPVHPRSAAYMIYTSGSTGTPKAVVVEHGPLAAHCDALAVALPIEGGDRLLHFASVNFDAAHECWLAPLAVGASVTIAPPQPFAPDAAHALMVSESISVAAFPPAYLREFAAVAARDGVPPALRVLAFGGEALPQQAFEFVRRTFPSVRLINGYGPTEAVISPMLWPVEPGEMPVLADDDAYASLPIGRAIGPRVARIDGGASGEPGEGGELLLGGVCLARGYHGRPALTAERFIPDAHGEPGARVYRTGDLARLRADGAFDYLGRLDDQVQVRGVRVEPAEIAACLRALRASAAPELKRFLARTNLLLGEHAQGRRSAPPALVRETVALLWRDFALFGAAAEDVALVDVLHDYGLTVDWHVAGTPASEALWEADAARAERDAVAAAPTRMLGVVTVNAHAYEDFLQTADASMADLAVDPAAADAGAAWRASAAAYRVGTAACALGLGHAALLADTLGLAWRRAAHGMPLAEGGLDAHARASDMLRAALLKIAAGVAPPDLTAASGALGAALGRT
uniref:amino acid adenylation domain-containing protein n=1 Tax=Burkholderia diffusa TaxID=488732 RepID=UPI001CC4F7D4|nr:amino acid adenylation domain-containing protein [Burkholderia diffusa]